MPYQSIVDRAEKISDSEYKLFTEHNNSYLYRCLPRNSPLFLENEALWRQRVLEGEDILLQWIEDTSQPSPAYICWNYEGMAMLEVKLNTKFSQSLEENTYGSEINPFDYKGDEWVVDTGCQTPISSNSNQRKQTRGTQTE
jgi:hypothetical protein